MAGIIENIIMTSESVRDSVRVRTDYTSMKRYLAASFAAAVPCLLLDVFYSGYGILAMTATAFITATATEAVFARVRRKPATGGTLTFAVLLALMLPHGTPLWMVTAGSAFGILFGKEIFGGTGNHIFSPVLIAKGFLMFSYPQVIKGSYFGSMMGTQNSDAWIPCSVLILLGGAAMLVAKASNIRILCGLFFSAICLALTFEQMGILPYSTMLGMLVSDGFLFGACFIACDPSASPENNNAKIFYGILIGTTAVLMRTFSNYSEAMMSAILIGNIFAPMVDGMSGQAKADSGSPCGGVEPDEG